MPLISKVYIPNDEDFKQIVAKAQCYSDCLRALGLGTSGGSSTDILKRRIGELDCDISHFKKGRNGSIAGGKQTKYTIDEILVKNSSYANISSLKRRLINEKVLEYKCAKCGNTGEWQGEQLSLQLDHIDGDNRNHSRQNLRFLCPNCHSQTSTFSGRNKIS